MATGFDEWQYVIGTKNQMDVEWSQSNKLIVEIIVNLVIKSIKYGIKCFSFFKEVIALFVNSLEW